MAMIKNKHSVTLMSDLLGHVEAIEISGKHFYVAIDSRGLLVDYTLFKTPELTRNALAYHCGIALKYIVSDIDGKATDRYETD